MSGVRGKKIRRAIFILFMVLYFIALPAQAKYSGGSGTANDPYQIATAEDLMSLGGSPEDCDKHFILTANIDLDPNLSGRRVFDKALIAPDTDPTPSEREGGFDGTAFAGVFDGNGHKISHLTITGVGYLGLFGQLGSGARISNLSLEDVDVHGIGECVGGLAGENMYGCIATSYSAGTTTGDRLVGGLVGYNYCGHIIASHSSGAVTGSNKVGGLVGTNSCGIVTSYSTGMVTGDSDVGGLVGGNSGSIAISYSTGPVKGNESAGGLVGSNGQGVITKSFWNVETSGQATSAGGTGSTTAEMQDINTYLNAGWDFVDEISNGTCDYWQTAPGVYPWLRHHIDNGPVMPEGAGTAHEPFLIRDARDLGTVWLEPMAYYRLEASVDLSGITWSTAAIPWFWGIFDGNGYGISGLHIQGGGYLGLFGRLGSGGMIFNLGLEAVDIDGTGHCVGGLVGRNDASIANSYSAGVVRGNGGVGGLVGSNGGTITGSYNAGAVTANGGVGGVAGSNGGSIATSYNTGTVTGGSENNVGGLVGSNRGSIATSYSTGAVNGSRLVGGLVGNNDGNIVTSYNTGPVRGDWVVGGLVGWNDGDITTSYNAGMVTGSGSNVGGLAGRNGNGSIAASYSTEMVMGSEKVGGLVGYNGSGITSSYSAGMVLGQRDVGGLVGDNDGSIESGFWDVQTSGQTASAGGIGKITAEMQAAGTFLEAGWDFVDEVVNGTDDIWWILEGQDYPRLRWERPTGDTMVLVVDDFESYNRIHPPDPESHRIFDIWIDGFGTSTNGALVGYDLPPYEWTIAHTGKQSMPFRYDNSGPPNYSEARAEIANLLVDRDWTIEGVEILSLWFYGNPANAPEPMYVALADATGAAAVVYHEDPNATQITTWTEWRIDLQAFIDQGVDLTDVGSISIGFGDKNNPQPGGSGLVFFDDIRLYRR